MNGWVRIGVVLSVIWAFVGGFWGNKRAINDASTLTNAQVENCLAANRARPRSKSGEIWTPCWEQFGKNYQLNAEGHLWFGTMVGLLPIPIAWLSVYVLIQLRRWKRRRAVKAFSGKIDKRVMR